MQEEFRDIPGYEGIYQVSNLGNVKSLNYNNTKKEKFLTNSLDNNMYLRVGLSNNKVLKTIRVHQLVAMAFLGYVRNGKLDVVVDHKDNDKLNNNLNNLQLLSNRNNCIKDKKRKIDLPCNIYKHGPGYAIRIYHDKKHKSFGTHKTIEEAIKVLSIVKNKLEL
jgi:hypothetical protein